MNAECLTVTTKPERIVVKAKARYVPGDEFEERRKLMKNLICQEILGRDFDGFQNRFYVYRGYFSFPDRSCFFLLDCGHTTDDNVPISLYKWDGKSMLRQQLLPPQMLKILKERYPFKPKPMTGLVTFEEVTPERRREMIKQRLRMNMKVNVVEIAFLRDNPHQVQWLLESVDPILWPKIHLLVDPESSADVQKEV